MTGWAIDVRPAAGERDAVAAWLVSRTGEGIEERDDGTLVTFASDEARADAIIHELQHRPGGAVIALRRAIPLVDWSTAWRDGLGARRFGRLVVAPSWITVDPGAGVVVALDPESAFGTGEHGSTRAALTLLERYLASGDRVTDLGSGSGILAIAAVKLGAAHAAGVELDAASNAVAERNAERNAVSQQVVFLEGDAADMAALVGPADLLLSNILRTVNVRLLPAIVAALRPAGIGIFSGMEEAEASLFRPALAAAGFDTLDEVTDAGWWAVAARRP